MRKLDNEEEILWQLGYRHPEPAQQALFHAFLPVVENLKKTGREFVDNAFARPEEGNTEEAKKDIEAFFDVFSKLVSSFKGDLEKGNKLVLRLLAIHRLYARYLVKVLKIETLEELHDAQAEIMKYLGESGSEGDELDWPDTFGA